MNELKNNHHRLQDPNHVHHPHPYWRRAHRDWRVWVVVILMVVIMLFYVRRGTLGRPTLINNQPTVSGPAVK